MRFSRQVATAVALTYVLAGCGSTYYMIKDPQSGRQYYSTEVTRSGDKVTFKDARTRSTVSLSNSEVMEITADQFHAGTGGPE